MVTDLSKIKVPTSPQSKFWSAVKTSHSPSFYNGSVFTSKSKFRSTSKTSHTPSFITGSRPRRAERIYLSVDPGSNSMVSGGYLTQFIQGERQGSQLVSPMNRGSYNFGPNEIR